jgi:ankyrin repeat protein
MSTSLPLDLQQHDEPEGHQEPPALPPVMSGALRGACITGNVGKVMKLLDDGESVNCVHHSTWRTPIMFAMMSNHLHVVQLLAERGGNLLMVDILGWNLLHLAAYCGDEECLEWVFGNTMIDFNSATKEGKTPLIWALYYNRIETSMLLVEKGANLFMKPTESEDDDY